VQLNSRPVSVMSAQPLEPRRPESAARSALPALAVTLRRTLAGVTVADLAYLVAVPVVAALLTHVQLFGDGSVVALALNVAAGVTASLPIAVALLDRIGVRHRHRIEAATAEASATDPVGQTGKRVGFDARLRDLAVGSAGAIPTDRRGVAIAIVDIDGFGRINAERGRQAADAILVILAERMHTAVGARALVARLDGDRFGVVAAVGDPDDAGSISSALLGAFRSSFAVDEQPITCHGSIGLAVTPMLWDGKVLVDTLTSAERGCVQAKAAGGGRVVAATSEATADHADRLLIADLHRAVRRNEFELQYQPIVDVTTGRMVKVEALLRWQHPTEGRVAPSRFVGLLESSGLMTATGSWALQQAARDLVSWRSSLPIGMRPPIVNVNVSPTQLAWSGFTDLVHEVLEEHRLLPEQLCLEITEGAIVEDAGGAWQRLRELKALGVQIALDDFGTGYSSLSLLRSFAVDAIKIDMSFTRNMLVSDEDRAIVAGVLGLASGLGVAAVVEGVESDPQLDALRQMGCRYVQGYRFGAPMTAREVFERSRNEQSSSLPPPPPGSVRAT
jgi:diguanylate cyclase